MTKLKQFADFTGFSLYVGIDVHLKNWDVSVNLGKQNIRSFHQAAECSVLINTLKRDYPNAEIHCAYEAGFSGFWLQRELTNAGISCIVVNAADIPQTDKERKTKTDRRDSKKIAQALEAGQLNPIFIPDIESEGHRRLVRYRLQLLRDLNKSKARVKHLLHQQGIAIPKNFKSGKWSKAFFQWLRTINTNIESLKYTLDKMIIQVEQTKQELKDVTNEMEKLLENEKYKKTADILMGIPGVGPITAVTLIVEINDIKRFSSFKKFNSYIGFCPGEHSSGESERKGHIISRNHNVLRALLIEAAWMAVKKDPALLISYTNLIKRMTGKRAIIKIARKLLNRIYHVWYRGENYQKGVIN
jgi:transposase